MRSVLGAEFFNTIRTKCCHLHTVASDIWDDFSSKKSTKCCQFSEVYLKWGGNAVRFWGQTSHYDEDEMVCLLGRGRILKKKGCQFCDWFSLKNGCPFFVKLSEKKEMLSTFRVEFLLKEWEEMLPLWEPNFFSRVLGHAARFLAKLPLPKRSNRSGIFLREPEEVLSIVGQIFLWMEKTRSTFRAELLKSRREWCPLPLIRKGGSAFHFFRNFLLSRRKRRICRFCSWASSQEQVEMPSIFWPRRLDFSRIWCRRDSHPFFGCPFLTELASCRYQRNRRKPFPFFPDVLARCKTNRTISTKTWEYDASLFALNCLQVVSKPTWGHAVHFSFECFLAMSKLWKSGNLGYNSWMTAWHAAVSNSLVQCSVFSTWMVLSQNFPCASISLPIHRENWHYEVMLHNFQHLPPWTCVRCCFSTFSVLKRLWWIVSWVKFGVCLSKNLPFKRLVYGSVGPRVTGLIDE